MAQETPSNILYSQAIESLRKLRQLYATNVNQTPDSISVAINGILGSFMSKAGKALTQYDPVRRSEIPLSGRMNAFWSSLQADINSLQNEVDLLNSTTIFSHNYFKTEILKSKNENLRLGNKIKTLELYSNASDNSIIHLGDSFITEQFIDWDMVLGADRATFLEKGHVSLHLNNQQSNFGTGTKVTVLSDSNGFFGNNQEIADPFMAPVNPTTGERIYSFLAESSNPSSIKTILDDKPNTWFEFEKYKVRDSDVETAQYNFDYKIDVTNPSTAHLKPSNSTLDLSTNTNIRWSDGPSDGVLTLNLEIDLGSTQPVNIISLLPYGLPDNINNPIKVVEVSASLDGSTWDIIGPENVWIANSIDKKISSIDTESLTTGAGVWIGDGTIYRFIRVRIEQPKPIPCNIGHLYYITTEVAEANSASAILPSGQVSNGLTYNANVPYNVSLPYGGAAPIAYTSDLGYTNFPVNQAGNVEYFQPQTAIPLSFRQQGPNPPAGNPQYYTNNKNALVNNLIQKIEFFRGQRWCIGIRDLNVKSNIYSSSGVLISKRFNVPGIIDRVALEADVIVPDSYDKSISWIKFFISPDDGATWFQISRIQDDFLGLPEVIAFNNPVPKELRESGVGYYDVKGTVNSLRFKAEFTRPSDQQKSSPILKSYKLKVVKRF